MVQVFWSSDRGGKLAAEGSTYRTSQNGTLHFPAVDKEDEGRYKCRVSNSLQQVTIDRIDRYYRYRSIDLSINRRLCPATEKRYMFFSSLLTGWPEVFVTC
jgi:hypothetical protein